MCPAVHAEDDRGPTAKCFHHPIHYLCSTSMRPRWYLTIPIRESGYAYLPPRGAPATDRDLPRISCEARLNKEEATLDTYLQDLRASSAASACSVAPAYAYLRAGTCSDTVRHTALGTPWMSVGAYVQPLSASPTAFSKSGH
jgi:hypothetical protein